MNKDAEGNECTFKTPSDWGNITGVLMPGAYDKVVYADVDPESGELEIVVEVPVIQRVQFTAYDRYMHPEIDNDEYLEHELVETGVSSQVCSYGWIEINTANDGFEWIKKADVAK